MRKMYTRNRWVLSNAASCAFVASLVFIFPTISPAATIFQDSFDDPNWNGSAYRQVFTTNTSYSLERTIFVLGGQSIKANWPPGGIVFALSVGEFPEIGFLNLQEIYMRFWTRFDTAFYNTLLGAEGITQKTMNFNQLLKSPVGGLQDSPTYLHSQTFRGQFTALLYNQAAYHITTKLGIPAQYNFPPTATGKVGFGDIYKPNTWHCNEFRLKLGSPKSLGGNEDGAIQWWVDGELITSYENIITSLPGSHIKWATMGHGMPHVRTEVPLTQWYDEFVLANTRIGCGLPPPPDTTPPTPPTGLGIVE
ncbi:MAG: hypothetical protein ACE5JU_06640 [Candidatus Binatia bacterium]